MNTNILVSSTVLKIIQCSLRIHELQLMALWWWVVSAGVSWCHKCGGNITELRTFSWVNPSKKGLVPQKNAQKASRKSKESSWSFLSHRGAFKSSMERSRSFEVKEERSRSFEVKEERTWITMTSRSWKNLIKNDRDVIVIVFSRSNFRHYDQKPSVQNKRRQAS
jgi:hypothetical protein